MSQAAVLFAGGFSRRMGRDKACLRWDDRSLLEHQAATLRATGARDLFLSCRADQTFALPGFTPVHDRDPGAGALAALADLWTLHPAEIVLVLAVDMPRVPGSWLRELGAHAKGETRTIVPRTSSGYEPLAAAWQLSCLPDLQAAQDSGLKSFQSLCAQLEARGKLRGITAANFPPAWLVNLNCPTDLPA